MNNANLIRFLSAVQRHSETTMTIMAASGLDPMELQVAVRCAEEKGFVAGTGRIHPALRITAVGREWIVDQMAEFEPLFQFLPRHLGDV